jgi:hypothetical protein
MSGLGRIRDTPRLHGRTGLGCLPFDRPDRVRGGEDPVRRRSGSVVGLAAADAQFTVGELEALGGAALGPPVVEGGAGDAEFLAELVDGQVASAAGHGPVPFRVGHAGSLWLITRVGLSGRPRRVVG